MSKKIQLSLLLQEYIDVVDYIYGVYLDGKYGFELVGEKFGKEQKESIVLLFKTKGIKLTVDELDRKRIYYGKGNPNLPESYILHETTQGEYKKRNEANGQNVKMLGNLCIIQVYQYWEDYYRGKIAEYMDKPKNDIKIDIMGDLRLLRISIIHHQAIALNSITQYRFLNWFKENDEICINQQQFEFIIYHVKEGVRDFLMPYLSLDT